jgi:exoribonuclease R
MSLIKKFSVGYSIEKSKKRKRENYESTLKSALNNDDQIKKEFLSEEVVEPLLNFGYSISQIMKAYKIYKFSTVDEAIYFLMRDPETKKFNHRYIPPDISKEYDSLDIPKVNENLCFLCNEKIEDHIYHDLEEKDFRGVEHPIKENRNHISEEINDTTFNLDKSNIVLKTQETGLMEKKSNRVINKIKKIEIPQSQIDLFEDPNICTICFDEILGESNSVKFTCGHKFCKNCVTHHLNVNINSGKVN